MSPMEAELMRVVTNAIADEPVEPKMEWSPGPWCRVDDEATILQAANDAPTAMPLAA